MDFKRADLEKLIKEYFGIDKITSLMNTQIGKFVTERGYSYKEIAQALVFFAEIDKGTLELKYGLGIVPVVMDRSKMFFERKRKEKEEQLKSLENKDEQSNIILYKQKQKATRKIEKISLEELEE